MTDEEEGEEADLSEGALAHDEDQQQQHGGKQAVHHGWFELDEGRVADVKRQATEHQRGQCRSQVQLVHASLEQQLKDRS